MNSLVGNYIVNKKLVKITNQPDGSISILAYDRKSREFIIDPQFLGMIMYGREDIKRLSEAEMEEYIILNR